MKNKHNLGNFPTDVEVGTKDAFHIPGVVVFSDRPLKPMQWVKLSDTTDNFVRECSEEDADGIIDYNLPSNVVIPPYKAVWMILKIDKVSDLTHTFSIKGVASPSVSYGAYESEDEWGCRGCV